MTKFSIHRPAVAPALKRLLAVLAVGACSIAQAGTLVEGIFGVTTSAQRDTARGSYADGVSQGCNQTWLFSASCSTGTHLNSPSQSSFDLDATGLGTTASMAGYANSRTGMMGAWSSLTFDPDTNGPQDTVSSNISTSINGRLRVETGSDEWSIIGFRLLGDGLTSWNSLGPAFSGVFSSINVDTLSVYSRGVTGWAAAANVRYEFDNWSTSGLQTVAKVCGSQNRGNEKCSGLGSGVLEFFLFDPFASTNFNYTLGSVNGKRGWSVSFGVPVRGTASVDIRSALQLVSGAKRPKGNAPISITENFGHTASLEMFVPAGVTVTPSGGFLVDAGKVPEPASIGIAGLGLLALLAKRLRRSKPQSAL